MPNYMLLLRDNPEQAEIPSPEDMQRVVEKYKAWGERLHQAGHLVDSNKLTDGAGRVVDRSNGQVRVLDGPYCETKEVVGGYFTVQAETYDQAVELCQDCPHLDYGSIEVREVEIH